MLNTIGLKQSIDNTRPAPLSKNDFTTAFLHEFEIVYKYFVI